MAGDDRIGMRMPSDLKQWAMQYAKRHNTTISALIVRFLIRLKHEEEKKNNQVDAEQV